MFTGPTFGILAGATGLSLNSAPLVGLRKNPGVWVGKILRRCFTGQVNPDQQRRTAIAENYRPRVGLVVLALVRTLGSLRYRNVQH